jgi:hypothetical protein
MNYRIEQLDEFLFRTNCRTYGKLIGCSESPLAVTLSIVHYPGLWRVAPVQVIFPDQIIG